MGLCKPKSLGASSNVANSMQHEAAMRVQARLDAEAKKKRRMELKKTLASWSRIFALLALVGGLAYAYANGYLDRWLPGGAAEISDDAAVLAGGTEGKTEIAAPPAAVEPVKVKVDVDDLVADVERDYKQRIDAEDAFAGASLDLWKNALAQDKPKKGGGAVAFVGLVPDGRGGHTLLNLELGGAKGLSVIPFAVGAKPTPLSRAAFNRLTAETPYLVLREGRAYCCSPSKRKIGSGSCAVPAKKAAFNPSRNDLGLLYDEIMRLKMKPSKFRYKVTLLLEKFSRRLQVGSFGVGEDVTHDALLKTVRELADDAEVGETLLASAVVEYAIE